MRFVSTMNQPKKVDMDFVRKHSNEIRDLCRQYDISLFYIYGSLSSDKTKTLSDIDIAIMSFGKNYSLNILLKIINQLQNIFGREDIDLVELDNAAPSLKMCVLKNGKLIYSKSKTDEVNFCFKTICDYLSTNYLRKSFYRYMERAIHREAI